jgi:hypothetical protein
VASLQRALGARSPALIVSGDTGDAARAEVAGAGFTLLAKPLVAAALASAAAAALGRTKSEERPLGAAPRVVHRMPVRA